MKTYCNRSDGCLMCDLLFCDGRNGMNKYIPHLPIVEGFARQLISGAEDEESKYRIITGWVSKNIMYDYIKATKVAKKKGVAPDPVACFETHLGICQDIASLTAVMLRAAGIRCYVCIGHADRAYHAWVQAYIGGKVYRYDHEGAAKVYRVERTY